MKLTSLSIIFTLFSQLAFASSGVVTPPAAPQVSSCIKSTFRSVGDQYWRTVTLTLTNKCTKDVDLTNTTVSFKNKSALNTSFWGNFSPLPYPDQPLNISSQLQADGTYLAILHMHFTAYPGANTLLRRNQSIDIQYGVNADTHINETTQVYIEGTPVESGNLQLNNASRPSSDVQNYSIVHITMNGVKISDINLPWNSTITVPNLTPGTYTVSPEDLTDRSGNTFHGTAVPSTITIAANQLSTSSITYSQTQHNGKITLTVGNLPKQLSGYTTQPKITLRSNQTGSTTSQTINWNTSATINQLKIGDTYTFSTDSINYNGFTCTPSFNPSSIIANNTPSISQLQYNCVQTEQQMVTLNASGAPISLSSVKITLTPNNSTAPLTVTIPLNNGIGSNTVMVSKSAIYNLSADTVSGYVVKISPQLLTPSANSTVTIGFTKASTPVAMNGQLSVCGTKLCNAQNNPIQLRGMSTHGLQWYGEGVCITPTSLDALVQNFKASVIRLSMYIQEDGYETNPTKFTQEVNSLISQASARGIYVIVDWHMLTPGDPNYNLERAKTFFTNIATTNKDRNNLLYEIANEPNGVSWAAIKSYANALIPIIRAIDAKTPILIGTRAWSSLGVSDGSDYKEIVNNPINFPNIMYTFHFYAASHLDDYLNVLDQASNTLPIFVTEFGTQTYSGGGNNDFVMSDKYLNLMANKKISWTNWNYSDDFLSGAIWKEGTCAKNVWTDQNLKPSGTYIKNRIINS